MKTKKPTKKPIFRPVVDFMYGLINEPIKNEINKQKKDIFNKQTKDKLDNKKTKSNSKNEKNLKVRYLDVLTYNRLGQNTNNKAWKNKQDVIFWQNSPFRGSTVDQKVTSKNKAINLFMGSFLDAFQGKNNDLRQYEEKCEKTYKKFAKKTGNFFTNTDIWNAYDQNSLSQAFRYDRLRDVSMKKTYLGWNTNGKQGEELELQKQVNQRMVDNHRNIGFLNPANKYGGKKAVAKFFKGAKNIIKKQLPPTQIKAEKPVETQKLQQAVKTAQTVKAVINKLKKPQQKSQQKIDKNELEIIPEEKNPKSTPKNKLKITAKEKTKQNNLPNNQQEKEKTPIENKDKKDLEQGMKELLNLVEEALKKAVETEQNDPKTGNDKNNQNNLQKTLKQVVSQAFKNGIKQKKTETNNDKLKDNGINTAKSQYTNSNSNTRTTATDTNITNSNNNTRTTATDTNNINKLLEKQMNKPTNNNKPTDNGIKDPNITRTTQATNAYTNATNLTSSTQATNAYTNTTNLTNTTNKPQENKPTNNEKNTTNLQKPAGTKQEKKTKQNNLQNKPQEKQTNAPTNNDNNKQNSQEPADKKQEKETNKNKPQEPAKTPIKNNDENKNIKPADNTKSPADNMQELMSIIKEQANNGKKKKKKTLEKSSFTPLFKGNKEELNANTTSQLGKTQPIIDVATYLRKINKNPYQTSICFYNKKQNNGKQQSKTNYNKKKEMKLTKPPINNNKNLKKPINNNKTQPLSQSGIKQEMQKNTNKKTLQPSQSESQMGMSQEEKRTIDQAIKTASSKQKQRKQQFYKSQNSFYPHSYYCPGKYYHLKKLDQKHKKKHKKDDIIPAIKRMNEESNKYREENKKLELYKSWYGDRKGEEFYYKRKLNKQNFIGQDNKKQKLSQHVTYQNLDNLKSPVNSY